MFIRFAMMLLPAAIATISVLSVDVLAAEMRDPTAPPPSMTTAAPAGAKTIPKLTSVLIARDRRVAVIDGITLMEGSEQGGMRLLRVTATGAEVRKDGRTMQLALSDTNMTRERR